MLISMREQSKRTSVQRGSPIEAFYRSDAHLGLEVGLHRPHHSFPALGTSPQLCITKVCGPGKRAIHFSGLDGDSNSHVQGWLRRPPTWHP
jgi:hypothetical protein